MSTPSISNTLRPLKPVPSQLKKSRKPQFRYVPMTAMALALSGLQAGCTPQAPTKPSKEAQMWGELVKEFGPKSKKPDEDVNIEVYVDADDNIIMTPKPKNSSLGWSTSAKAKWLVLGTIFTTLAYHIAKNPGIFSAFSNLSRSSSRQRTSSFDTIKQSQPKLTPNPDTEIITLKDIIAWTKNTARKIKNTCTKGKNILKAGYQKVITKKKK